MLAFDLVVAAINPPAGGYISTIKVIPVLLVLMAWGRMLTWADTDAVAAHLPRTTFNLSNLAGMVLAFALFFVLPTFILAFLALLLIAGAEAGIYLTLRKRHVGIHDLRQQFNEWIDGFRGKQREVATPGRVTIMGKDGKSLPVPENNSPDRPAYDAIQLALTNPIEQNAQQVDLAPDGDGLAVKYVVDNFTHRGAAVDRTVGGAAISYIKWAAGLNIEDRRKPQTGNLKVLLDKTRHELRVQTAGTTAGEYLRVVVDPKIRHSYKLSELGFTSDQLPLIEDVIKERGGVVLLSTPKGHGLTSLFYTILRSHDAFLEHGQTIERDQEQDIEGITQNKLPANAAAGEEFKMTDWIISQEPNLLGMSKVEDPKSAATLIEFAKHGHRVYVCMRANSTFEALEQWKRLVGNNAKAMEALKMVVNGRVLRKLCIACKEGFTPDPATLKKLNLSPDRATTLFKAREQPMRDAKGKVVPCEFCHELRFKGRAGVFEILVVNDEVRQAVETGKPLNQALMNQVFRKQRGKYLQEAALALVETGDTSVQEVLRVLKPAAEGASAEAKPAATTKAAPSAPARNR